MKETLIINEPRIENDEKYSRMISTIECGEKKYDLFYQVEKKYSDYFSFEVSDAFVVCVLLYCMEHNLNIMCKGKMSEILLYQLREFLVPAISKNIKKYNSINIDANVVNIQYDAKGVGTGLSCGVDSFYTIVKHNKYSKESNLRVTHATFFNAGASGEFGGDEARNMFLERRKIFEKVAQEINLEFVCVDSNMNEFLKQNHQATHTFRTLSIPLALQKMFGRYYFSSGTVYSSFKFEDYDTAYYDILSTSLLSTQNLKINSIGGECTRLEKLEFISNEDIVKNNLNVCVPEVTNCSKCHKCVRTILELYALNKLELFSHVFDINYFYNNKNRYLIRAVTDRHGDDMKEVYKVLRKQGKIKFWHVCAGMIKKTLSLFKRALKKIIKCLVKKNDRNNG